MKIIYKIALMFCLIALILVIGNLKFAQGKGYFFEKDNKFYIFDNLVIGNPITGSGYLVVEQNKSEAKGLGGDVLVGNNFIIDSSSEVNFCKDLGGANRDCNQKIMAWTSTGLNVIDPDNSFYQLQTQNIEAPDSDLNFVANENIIANSAVKLTGCFSNYSTDCALDLRTTELYLDNIASLDAESKVFGGKISLIPGTLEFEDLNLGEDETIELPNVTITTLQGSISNVKQLNLQNICWKYGWAVGFGALNPPCAAPATGGGGLGSTWYFGPGTTYPGYYGPPGSGGALGGGTDLICCALNVTY